MHQLHITPDFHSDKCTMFAQKLKTTWKKQQQKPIILCDNIRNMTKILAGQMTEYDTQQVIWSRLCSQSLALVLPLQMTKTRKPNHLFSATCHDYGAKLLPSTSKLTDYYCY